MSKTKLITIISIVSIVAIAGVGALLISAKAEEGCGEFSNVSCPIMGSPINPEKVGENLVRDYEGQKIAFCCGGCPNQWDKLTNAEKDAKLAEVKPAEKDSEKKY